MAEASELLGQQHGDHEVGEEEDGDDAEDDGFHGKGRPAAQRIRAQKWA
jgi:hypothetical protein